MNQLQALPNVELFENTKPLKIEGKSETGVEKITFEFNSQLLSADVEAVFIENGVFPSSALAIGLGVELDNQFIKVGSLQETNVPGLYAAGDITGGKARQAIISSGDGARASIGAIDYLKKVGRGTKKLKTTQWGESKKKEEILKMDQVTKLNSNQLVQYIEKDDGFLSSYQRYITKEDLTEKIASKLKNGKVVTVSAMWCPDCRRNVPRMAKISESLNDWDFVIEERDTEGVVQKYNIKKIPTFIVFDNEGKEIGRIIENPKTNSLENDLLEIVNNS
jgi:thiol-disulfide isomerase/thioredoxin